MTDLQPASATVIRADQPKQDRSSHLRLDLPATGQDPPFGELFVKVYEHPEQLRKNGYDEEAKQVDTSRNVTTLIGIAGERAWESFDAIWSAREFREILYHAIAPKLGGPLWLREAVKPAIAEEMCMIRIPHVRSFS